MKEQRPDYNNSNLSSVYNFIRVTGEDGVFYDLVRDVLTTKHITALRDRGYEAEKVDRKDVPACIFRDIREDLDRYSLSTWLGGSEFYLPNVPQQEDGVKYFIKRGNLYFKEFIGGETPNGLAKWTPHQTQAKAFDTEVKAQATKVGIIPYNGKGISIAAEAVEKKPSVRDWLKEASSAQADAPKASTPRKEAPSL